MRCSALGTRPTVDICTAPDPLFFVNCAPLRSCLATPSFSPSLFDLWHDCMIVPAGAAWCSLYPNAGPPSCPLMQRAVLIYLPVGAGFSYPLHVSLRNQLSFSEAHAMATTYAHAVPHHSRIPRLYVCSTRRTVSETRSPPRGSPWPCASPAAAAFTTLSSMLSTSASRMPCRQSVYASSLRLSSGGGVLLDQLETMCDAFQAEAQQNSTDAHLRQADAFLSYSHPTKTT